MVDYISDKRQLWQIIEAAFQKENGTKDWEKLWEFVKNNANIAFDINVKTPFLWGLTLKSKKPLDFQINFG